MEAGGISTWTERLINVIVRTNSASREVITNFFQQMEDMMFPDSIEAYQDNMRSIIPDLGALEGELTGSEMFLSLFPNKVALTSAALTAGGIVALAVMVRAIWKTISFIELNRHSLEKYDKLLENCNQEQFLKGTNVRTEKEMLKGMDAVKDNEGNFYSTTPDEYDNKPIFTQTDNDHLKFIPKYHRDTGIVMMPIPHDLRGAIIGFTILSDEQLNSPNMIKGLVVY